MGGSDNNRISNNNNTTVCRTKHILRRQTLCNPKIHLLKQLQRSVCQEPAMSQLCLVQSQIQEEEAEEQVPAQEQGWQGKDKSKCLLWIEKKLLIFLKKKIIFAKK